MLVTAKGVSSTACTAAAAAASFSSVNAFPSIWWSLASNACPPPLEERGHGPVLLLDERADLVFALADQT